MTDTSGTTRPDTSREQLRLLEAVLDRPTTGFLQTVGVQRGWRCLEVGAGGGSISRWLAEQAGTTGTVVAVDRAVDQLSVPPSVEVHQHDIHDGVPAEGGFDLIHARLLLANLHRREEIFSMLVDALSPGGWLVLAEGTLRPQTVLASPGRAEEELFHRVLDATLEAAGARYSWSWADSVGERMTDIGLVDVDSSEYGYTATGGSPAGLLHSVYVRQLQPELLRRGISLGEIERFHALMRNPRFRVWCYMRIVFTRGRKQAIAPT